MTELGFTSLRELGYSRNAAQMPQGSPLPRAQTPQNQAPYCLGHQGPLWPALLPVTTGPQAHACTSWPCLCHAPSWRTWSHHVAFLHLCFSIYTWAQQDILTSLGV